MTSEKVKVLYIAGTMRSGSTLLGRLLAEMPDAVAVGELGLLFSRAFRDQSPCGCLQRVYDCDFWRAVFMRAFGGIDRLDLAALHETKQAYRIRSLPRLLLARHARSEKGKLQNYLQELDALYRSVQEISEARIVIDTSKDPLYACLLRQVPSIDLRIVHLVRDSRAVAYSQQRVKSDPPLFSNPSLLPLVKPLRTALVWNIINGLLSFIGMKGPSLCLRYEDFAADPANSLRQVWEFMNEPSPPLDFLHSSPMHLHTSHTVAGNPDRFRSDVTIQPDLEWRQKMSLRDRWLVTALTWPGLLHYQFLKLPSRVSRKRVRPSHVL